MMSDVEGGDVERAANLLGSMPSARQLARTMSPAQIIAYALNLGRRLRAIGMTMDLAPVMDLDAGLGPSALDPDGTRSFSDDAHMAATDAAAFSAGLAEAGVIAVAKHFPGILLRPRESLLHVDHKDQRNTPTVLNSTVGIPERTSETAH